MASSSQQDATVNGRGVLREWTYDALASVIGIAVMG